jgi:hypothetical protein
MGLLTTGRHAAYLPVHALSSFDVEILTAKMKRYKLPSGDKISAELIEQVKHLRSEIHTVVHSAEITESFLAVEGVSILAPNCVKGDKPDCSNYQVIRCIQ